MRLLSIYMIVLLVLLSNICLSQTLNHSTVKEVVIAHKAISSGTTTANGKHQIKMRPEAIVKLKPGDVKKIYFKMLKGEVVLANISYRLDSIPVMNNSGVKLFYSDNNSYHLVIPDTFLIDNYSYEIKTEDSNGNPSQVISKSK